MRGAIKVAEPTPSAGPATAAAEEAAAIAPFPLAPATEPTEAITTPPVVKRVAVPAATVPGVENNFGTGCGHASKDHDIAWEG